MIKIKLLIPFIVFCLILSGCGTFFDKDNTPTPVPLVAFTPELKPQKIWGAHVGSGTNGEYLKLPIVLSNDTLFAANQNGYVTATDKMSGHLLWRSYVDTSITSGVSAFGGQIFVGGRDGSVFALDQKTGAQLWKAYASSEILAPLAANQKIVVAKSIDDHLTAFSFNDGHIIWRYQKTSPALILRGASAPRLTHDSVIAGFEDGQLAKLSLSQGHVDWQQAIGMPQGSFLIQRMVDIDADPIILGDHIFAATYQGRVAALHLRSGNIKWTQDISSYSGIAADQSQVYVSDAEGHIWAFNAQNGEVNWQQNGLTARNVTGPALMDSYLVVGDGEGYLHWLSKKDGRFVGRVSINRSGILATPLVDNGIVYVYTRNGQLQAYKTVS